MEDSSMPGDLRIGMKKPSSHRPWSRLVRLWSTPRSLWSGGGYVLRCGAQHRRPVASRARCSCPRCMEGKRDLHLVNHPIVDAKLLRAPNKSGKRSRSPRLGAYI